MSTTSTPNRQQWSVEQESNLQTLMVIGTDWVRIMMFNATFNNILCQQQAHLTVNRGQ